MQSQFLYTLIKCFKWTFVLLGTLFAVASTLIVSHDELSTSCVNFMRYPEKNVKWGPIRLITPRGWYVMREADTLHIWKDVTEYSPETGGETATVSFFNSVSRKSGMVQFPYGKSRPPNGKSRPPKMSPITIDGVMGGVAALYADTATASRGEVFFVTIPSKDLRIVMAAPEGHSDDCWNLLRKVRWIDRATSGTDESAKR